MTDPDRFRVRRSETKIKPDTSDLERSEMAYTTPSKTLWMRDETTGQVVAIGGQYMQEAIAALQSQVAGLSQGINRLPVAQPDSATADDIVGVVTGSVLANDTDPEGGVLTVVAVRYANVARTVGTTFSTTYGSMSIQASGGYTFTPSAAARALKVGQSATESFTYNVIDVAGGISSSSLTIFINGTNSAPKVINDVSLGKGEASEQTGNVLSNDSDPEGDPMAVVSFSVDGVNGSFVPGAVVDIPSFGTFTMAANGAWTRVRGSQVMPGNIVVRYVASDGVGTSNGTLTIVLTEQVVNVSSNPVTEALSGTRTFNVGPGQTYAEPNDVPWSTLQAGDVVNIFWRSTPYVAKFGLWAQGQANAPIIINGVTDANGSRPIIDGNNAHVAPGCMPGGGNDLFGVGGEGFGVITIKRRPATPYSENPSWITIQNLEITGGLAENSFITSTGVSVLYDFSAGIWLQPANDITIRNNVIHGCAQGIFTQAKQAADGTAGECCQRIRLVYNRIYGNGTVANGYHHGAYMQGYDIITEGNYFGTNLPGAGGATYKSRASKEVIRYNWMEQSSRILDLVHPEFPDAFVTYPDFGTDYVYGNVLINDERIADAAWLPIRYGSDNSTANDLGGEWATDNPGLSLVSHRRRLYYFANTFYLRCNLPKSDQMVLKLSWPDTVCEAWGNIFLMRGSNNQLNFLHVAGTLNLRGTNVILGYGNMADAATGRGATPQSYQINRMGTVIAADPLFTSEDFYDFALSAGSPAIDIYGTLPSGIPAQVGVDYPVQGQPLRQLNGVTLRPTNIGATDLGALERDPNAPPRVAPILTTPAVFDINNAYVVGATISFTDPSWLYNPTSVTRNCQRLVDGTWIDIPGATANSLTLAAEDTGGIRVHYVATNAAGSTTYDTQSYAVTSTPAAAVVQIASAVDPYPSQLKTAVATLTQAPSIGSTLVAFLTHGSAIGDNFGNAWVKREDLASGMNWKFQLYTCTVTTTGANFQVTGSSTGSWNSGLVVYEVTGAYVSSVAEASAGGDIDPTVTITADAPNQRIIAAFAAGREWSEQSITVDAPWVTGALFNRSQLLPLLTVVHGVSSGAGPNNVTANFGGTDNRIKLAVLIA